MKNIIVKSLSLSLLLLFLFCVGCDDTATFGNFSPTTKPSQTARTTYKPWTTATDEATLLPTDSPSPSTTPSPTPSPTLKPSATPSPTKKPTPAPTQAPEAVVVYITDTGEKYHRAGCRHLSKSKQEISLAKAVAQGYTPCGTCKPPRL
jgi:viral protein TPX